MSVNRTTLFNLQERCKRLGGDASSPELTREPVANFSPVVLDETDHISRNTSVNEDRLRENRLVVKNPRPVGRCASQLLAGKPASSLASGSN